MKSVLLMLLFCGHVCVAQIDVPELSPEGMLSQKVGYTQFTIHYGRPAARQRKIMGELVPYDRLWRTGAGKCTTIAFDREVTINGQTIPAGAYAIVTIPGRERWTLMLNSDTTRIYGHPSEYDPKTEAVRLQVTSAQTDRYYESFTIDLDIVKYDAVLYMSWENTQIHFPIQTGSHKKGLDRIKAALEKNPRDPETLAQASYYYTMNNEDPGQVLRWLDLAIASGGDRWVYHQKVDLLAREKRYPEARKASLDAIAFLQRTKPVEWETEVSNLEDKMKAWPKR